MIVLNIYLVTLVIAPQLWVSTFLNWPTDVILFPLMLGAVALSGRLQELYRFHAVDRLFLAFVLWITVSAVANGWTPQSQVQVFFYFKWFVLFKLIVAILGADAGRIRRSTTFFVVIVSILAIEVVQHRLAGGLGWAGQTLDWIDPTALAAGEKGRARWVGIFDGPGVLAVLFTMALGFPLCALAYYESKARRVLLLLVVALLFWAIYCTGSRGGMLATLAVVSLAIMLRAGVSLRTIILSAGIAGVAYLVAPDYLTTIRDESKSSQYRVEMWAAGLDMIKSSPVFGIGIANFKEYSGRLIGHNSAVELMGETGMVGLSLWVSLLYVSVKGLLVERAQSVDLSQRWFATAMLLALAGYLTSAMFVTLEYETLYVLLAWCAALNRNATEVVAFTLRDGMHVGAILVGWLVALQAFVILYLG